jgi:hypothetical protein
MRQGVAVLDGTPCCSSDIPRNEHIHTNKHSLVLLSLQQRTQKHTHPSYQVPTVAGTHVRSSLRHVNALPSAHDQIPCLFFVL